MSRYALYFAPEPNSLWWRVGCQWLGRDASTMSELTQPAISGMTNVQMHTLTADARRYGFHATLKAPFRLAQAYDIQQLDAALSSFCEQQESFILPTPQVQWMGNFLALRPGTECAEINALATACVRHFHHFSAALTTSEITRRAKQTLSQRQRDLLLRWGYPYTEEEFRFHLTLSDTQKDLHSATSTQLRDAAVQYFSINEVLKISSIALFHEERMRADFKLLKHYNFKS